MDTNFATDQQATSANAQPPHIKIGALNLCQGLQLKKNIVKETIIYN